MLRLTLKQFEDICKYVLQTYGEQDLDTFIDLFWNNKSELIKEV